MAQQFENAWLARYPRPINVIFDQGREFTGYEFQQMLHHHGIHARPTTIKNPQANAICERLHQTIANVLRPLLMENPPNNFEQATMVLDTALQTAAYSVCATIHGTLQISPGALVFHRDMLLDLPLIADLHLLCNRRQVLTVDASLMIINRMKRCWC